MRWHTNNQLSTGFVACLTVVTIGCGENKPPPPSRPLVLVASGDTSGWIVPCGCTSNQSGGLLRRGDYVSQLQKKNQVVYVDVGGASAATSRYDQVKFESILRGEAKMGIKAHNIGRVEAQMGADYLRQLAKDFEFPFVSCNVRDQEGVLVANPIQIIETDHRRIAVIGVLSPSVSINEIRIEPPSESILSQLEESRDNYDCVVVLAYLPEDELLELAEGLPEADVIIGGPTGQVITPRKVGPTLVTSATNKGKFIVELRATGDSPNWTGAVVEIGEEFTDDPTQAENLKAFYKLLSKHDFSATDTSFVQSLPPDVSPSYRIASTATCRECHTEDCDLWGESGHSKAWASLVDTGAQVDSYCQQCHTTGYGLPGGFASLTSSVKLREVGCESCHGPSLAHVNDPDQRTNFYRRAVSQCSRCHDRENSPQFVFQDYWPKIIHGK